MLTNNICGRLCYDWEYGILNGFVRVQINLEIIFFKGTIYIMCSTYITDFGRIYPSVADIIIVKTKLVIVN